METPGGQTVAVAEMTRRDYESLPLKRTGECASSQPPQWAPTGSVRILGLQLREMGELSPHPPSLNFIESFVG